MPVDFDKYDAVPEGIRNQIRFVGTVTTDKSSVRFDCAEWTVNEGVLCIKQALVDTSERHQGIPLKTRWTYLEEFYFGGNCYWTIRPLSADES